jgi:hypothetical protein
MPQPHHQKIQFEERESAVKSSQLHRLRLSIQPACIAAVLLLMYLWCSSTALAATGDANRAECPFAEASPGFRSALPDCRAYELVTPAYGAGAIATGVRNLAPLISPNGEHILGISMGPFAEPEDLGQVAEEYGAYYEFSRTPAGWSAESQDPPASVYPWYILEDASQINPGLSVWAVPGALPAGAEPERSWFRKNDARYILREGKNQFAEVGPAVAPGHEPYEEPKFSFIEAISEDASHIVFTDLARAKQLWPGDTTTEATTESRIERPSLYEYHGADGGEPVLVAVRNKGAAPWEPGAAHVDEGAELISQCGALYDGMSTSGETVFFTTLAAEAEVGGEKFCEEREGVGEGSGPAANELYARVNGSQTFKISGAANAVYHGTSEDGTKVFFSEAEDLYEYDFDTAKVTKIAAHVTGVAKISGDGSRIYFSSSEVLPTEPNANGETAQRDLEEGATSLLYVYDTDADAPTTAFVARGEEAASFAATIDGQFFVFTSPKHLQGTDDTSAESAPQLFEYDAATGGVERVSIGMQAPNGFECSSTGEVERGFNCNGNTTLAENAPRIVRGGINSIAANGTVVFTSRMPLAPGAVQDHAELGPQTISENVYEFRSGQVYLISAGDEPTAAHYQGHNEGQTRLFGIDESGEDVFFSSVDQLVPQDTDTQSSWYDARQEGGFPAPLRQSECAGEACQGAAPGAPSPLAALAPPAAEENAITAKAPAVVKPKTVAQIRAEKLAKALKACKGKRERSKRVACERSARRSYGPVKKARKADGGRRS